MKSPTLRVLVLGAVGFVLSGLLSGALGFARDTVVLGYAVVVVVVMFALYRYNPQSFRQVMGRHRISGIGAGLGLGLVLIISVMNQPASGSPSGLRLAAALAWLGLVYGICDGLLLTVAPVLAVFGRNTPRLSARIGNWARGAVALAASLFVTATYHLGYEEFRGSRLAQPLVGNAVITAGYLLTGSVATPLIGHVLMHGAAVVHGMETTSQLPPHYQREP